MSKLKLGFCGVCDTVEIWVKQPDGRVRKTDAYSEVSLYISDNTVAQHAICKSCRETLTTKKVTTLMGRIKATWGDEMVGWATKEQFDKMNAKTVITWDKSEASLKEKLPPFIKQLKDDRLKGEK